MRFLRFLLWLLAAAAVVAALVVGGVFFLSSHKLERHLSAVVAPIPAATGAVALADGHHIAVIRGCMECHGRDGGGAKVIDDAAMGRIYGPNLTSGQGGVGSTLTDQDWVRAIRHGLAPDGRPLFIMPSGDYAQLSDRDTAEIIAYLRSLPPVDRETPPIHLGPVTRALLASGKMSLSADEIDQSESQPVASVPVGITPEYGRYLATACTTCHNPRFSGGKIAVGPPDWPPAANLTRGPGSAIAGWTEADFIHSLRSMQTPDGRAINPAMPAVFGKMNDLELKAVWSYLQTLPPEPTGAKGA